MFVDYGGYAYNVPIVELRQIRYDFMSLPFQASECYLANVVPIDGMFHSLCWLWHSRLTTICLVYFTVENGWSEEANNLFEELAKGQIIYSTISSYAQNGIPFVNLFKVQDGNVSDRFWHDYASFFPIC